VKDKKGLLMKKYIYLLVLAVLQTNLSFAGGGEGGGSELGGGGYFYARGAYRVAHASTRNLITILSSFTQAEFASTVEQYPDAEEFPIDPNKIDRELIIESLKDINIVPDAWATSDDGIELDISKEIPKLNIYRQALNDILITRDSGNLLQQKILTKYLLYFLTVKLSEVNKIGNLSKHIISSYDLESPCGMKHLSPINIKLSISLCQRKIRIAKDTISENPSHLPARRFLDILNSLGGNFELVAEKISVKLPTARSRPYNTNLMLVRDVNHHTVLSLELQDYPRNDGVKTYLLPYTVTHAWPCNSNTYLRFPTPYERDVLFNLLSGIAQNGSLGNYQHRKSVKYREYSVWISEDQSLDTQSGKVIPNRVIEPNKIPVMLGLLAAPVILSEKDDGARSVCILKNEGYL
jgi:hypothetical protein